MWETVDPEGRTVVFPWRHWTHIVDRHPYIGVGPEALLDGRAARRVHRSPAKRILEREGKIPITLPEHRIEATDLGGALAVA